MSVVTLNVIIHWPPPPVPCMRSAERLLQEQQAVLLWIVKGGKPAKNQISPTPPCVSDTVNRDNKLCPIQSTARALTCCSWKVLSRICSTSAGAKLTKTLLSSLLRAGLHPPADFCSSVADKIEEAQKQLKEPKATQNSKTSSLSGFSFICGAVCFTNQLLLPF